MVKYTVQKKVPVIPKILKGLNRILFSVDIPYNAGLDYTVLLGHNGLGTVINKNTKVGRNTLLMQQVTLGGNLGKERIIDGIKTTSPVIGENVLVGAGAKIIGPIKIGDYAQIGAGAVVLDDIPTRAIAVGLPARVIRIQTVEEAKKNVSKW